MFDKEDLEQSFTEVEEQSGLFFFRLNLAETFDQYYLKSDTDLDLLILSEDIVDKEFASSVVSQVSGDFSQKKVAVVEILQNLYGFSHCLVLPNTYHGIFKSDFEEKRENLFLCVPIHKCEFSGDESAEEFKGMVQRTIPAFRWDREPHPKIRVYFDNPETGAGTDERGVIMKYSNLLAELDNISGVSSGFIEITNYAGEVVEVLSPELDEFTLIRHRRDEVRMRHSQLVDALHRFLFER